MKDKEMTQVTNLQLRSALGAMLRAWDDAAGALTAFFQDHSGANADAYSDKFPALFETVTLARPIYMASMSQPGVITETGKACVLALSAKEAQKFEVFCHQHSASCNNPSFKLIQSSASGIGVTTVAQCSKCHSSEGITDVSCW